MNHFITLMSGGGNGGEGFAHLAHQTRYWVFRNYSAFITLKTELFTQLRAPRRNSTPMNEIFDERSNNTA